MSLQPAALPPKFQTCQPSQLHNIYVVVQLLSHVRPFVTPWTAARQASLSFTISQSLPKLMSIESVMPSNHLILCCPLLLLPSSFPSTRVFSNESALLIRWPKYWSFSSYHDWFRIGCAVGTQTKLEIDILGNSGCFVLDEDRSVGGAHAAAPSASGGGTIRRQPSSHLVLSHPLLLLFSTFPIIRVFQMS